MKRQLFFIATLLVAVISFSSFSGGKCKFDYDKKDEFSGKSVRYSKFTLQYKGDYTTVGALIEYDMTVGDNSGQFYLTTDFSLAGETRELFTPSDTSLIKLENGKIIKIVPNDEFKPTAQLMGPSVFTSWKPIFNISKAKMQKLSESPIVAIKVVYGGKEFNIKPRDSKAAKVMETAACLTSE